MSIRRLSGIVLLAALIASCSSSPTDTGNPGGSGIGAAGGTVTSTDGSARLTVPAGALSSSVAITATPMTNPPAAPGLVTANTYDFGPSGTQFATPATLRITYQPSQLPSGADPSALQLVVLDGTVWDVVPGGTVDTAAHIVTGPINHFSGYGLCSGSCAPVAGTFVMLSAPDTLALPLGTSAGANISIVRTAFTDPVTLSVSGLPSGVTAAFNPAQLSGTATTSTVTFTASAAAIAGFTTVIVHGSTPTLADHVDTITLNVATFSITAIPPTVSFAAGSSGSTALRVSRGGGFSGALTYAVTGMPAGLTASINTTSVADSLQLALAASAALASGAYSLTVTATSGTVSQRVTVTVSVINAGSAYQFDYSTCTNKAVWFAYQDGSGPWTVVAGSNNVYTVPAFTSGKGGIAAVLPASAGHKTVVEYLTSSEMATNALQNSCATGATTTLIGSVSGMASGESAFVSLGTASGSTTANGPIQLENVPSGATDVVAYLQQSSGHSSIADRVIINRGATTPGAINFGGAFAVTATATVNGGSAPLPAPQMGYITNATSCRSALMYALTPSSSAFLFGGVPDSLQQPGDLHALTVIDAGTSGRQVTNWFHTMANQVLTYGAPLGPSIDTLLGNYRRLRASFTLPADYGFAALSIGPVGQPNQAINESSGYAAGAAMALVVPEFTGLTGFLPEWEPPVGTPQQYTLYAQSGSMFATTCTDGGVSRAANASGSQ